MIVVTDFSGDETEYDAARFYTDEHNNLCVEDAKELLLAVFAEGKWLQVRIEVDAD